MSSIYPPGRVIGGRYRIVSALSQGGMGAVYLAQQISLGRDVALKVILERDQDPELIKRFDIEARQVCLLKHPNIITYHDYGRDEDGHPYLVMEFLSGYPGTKLVLGERRTTLKDLVHVVAQMCSALHEAHQKGIIHRDLKWSNVMVCPQSHDPYFAKLIDFGIMKVATDGSSGDQRQLTVTGMLLGTPEYMSPEAICGMPIDGRADQYSLAVMLWEALEGQRPFGGSTQFETLRQQVQEPPPPFENARALLDAYPRLEAVVLRAMEKHPDDRYDTILALRDALVAAVGAGPSRALPPTRDQRPGEVPRSGLAQPVPKSQRLAAGPVRGEPPAPVDTAHRTGRERREPRASRARWWPLLLAGLVLVAGGAALAIALTDGERVVSAAPDATIVAATITTADAEGASPPETTVAAITSSALATTVAEVTAPPAVTSIADASEAPPDVAAPEADIAPAADTGPEPSDAPDPPDVAEAVADAVTSVDARPATKAAAVVPQAPGTLVIQAIPVAKVWINGVPHGDTVVTTTHKPGTVTIVFERIDSTLGKIRKTRSVKLKPGEKKTVIVDMKRPD
ncbi:MAG: protein kinase [Deltaproteobacteria bacterium]|nr:protein kinase [Deltaproteobacteria bacterium]